MAWRQWGATLLAALTLTVASGCRSNNRDGPGEDGPRASSDRPGSSASASAEVVVPPLFDTEPIDQAKLDAYVADRNAHASAEMIELSLRSVAACNVSPAGVVACNQASDFLSVLGRSPERGTGTALAKQKRALLLRYLRHSSPAVRIVAANGLQATSEMSATDLRLAAAIARAEPQPLVTAAILQAVRGILRGRDPYAPEIRDLMLWALASPDKEVRWAAARELAAIGSVPPPETYDPLYLLATTDKDLLVRADACSALGSFGDARPLELFRQVLASPTKLGAYVPEEVRGGCFSGLARMWVSVVPPKHPNKDAYDLTIETLEGNLKLLPSVPGELGSAERHATAFPPERKAWMDAVQAFYDPDRLERALVRIATSEEASDGCRMGAVTALYLVGAKDALDTVVTKTRASATDASKRVADEAERDAKHPLGVPPPQLSPPPVPPSSGRPTLAP